MESFVFFVFKCGGMLVYLVVCRSWKLKVFCENVSNNGFSNNSFGGNLRCNFKCVLVNLFGVIFKLWLFCRFLVGMLLFNVWYVFKMGFII